MADVLGPKMVKVQSYSDIPLGCLMLSWLWLRGRDQADVLATLLRQSGAICIEGILNWAVAAVHRVPGLTSAEDGDTESLQTH